ncbi:MAG: cell division protein ZipA [Gammaproteobacteria bacterium]
MDNLRWILLAIGCLIIAGIYFSERLQRQRSPKRKVDRFFEQDDTAGLNMPPRATEEEAYYREALADLNELLIQNRKPDRDAPASLTAADKSMPEPAPDVMAQSQVSGQDADQNIDAESDDEFDETAETADSVTQSQPRIVVLYLKAASGQEFSGNDLFSALAAVDMQLADMGIYHDINSRGECVFSIANLFEPGTLDIADRDNFTTRGLACFMQLPGPADEHDAFDRMLSKCEWLADRLYGELQDDQHRPLTDTTLQRLRAQLHHND